MINLADLFTNAPTVTPISDEELDAEVDRLFHIRTGGFTPETCPPEVMAEMMYETEDCDD